MVKQKSVPLFAARLAFYAAGLVVLAAGIILNTQAGLGVAPVNSLPYLVSELTPLTLGQVTTVFYLVCIVIQCILLRRVPLSALLQLPVSYVFGLLVDQINRLLSVVRPESLIASLFWLAVAILCIALGVVMVVGMKIVPNPPDGLVATIAEVSGKEFGFAKNCFDLTITCLSLLGGLIFARRVIGVGVGTILCALLVGRAAALFRRVLGGLMAKLSRAVPFLKDG